MKQIILRVPDQVHKDIKIAAALTDQSMQDIILKAVQTCDTVGEALERMKQGQGS
jgi:predicted HicB family RNase H-like nuclease